MRVSVGPLASASVLDFVTRARKRLDDLDRAGAPDATLPPDLRGAFDTYLDEWDRAAHRGDEFRWSAEVGAEYLQYLTHGLFRVVEHLMESGIDSSAPGLLFYRALVEGLVTALEGDDSSSAEYAAQLREFFPGIGELD
jgi:hypothetical protein